MTCRNDAAVRWNAFYADRSRGCGFFGSSPDECLVRWIERGLVPLGNALDVGCGNGRNAIYLARQGCEVDAIDLSSTAIAWAREAASTAAVPVRLECRSLFDMALAPGAYDLVYDSGCLHHLFPQERQPYVDLVSRALRPDGHLGLVCFRPEGGSGLTDEEASRTGSVGGGLGYSEDALRALWSPAFHIEELRPMVTPLPKSREFGEPFLWVMLARKRHAELERHGC